MSTEHKQGCEALGGYGNGVGPCSCGADNSEAMRLAQALKNRQEVEDDAADMLVQQSERIAELEAERDRLREEADELTHCLRVVLKGGDGLTGSQYAAVLNRAEAIAAHKETE